MYGKIFESMYDSTLAEDWRALITFQQFIVLCDADGVVDKTPMAISRRTGIPLEHIEAGIEILESADEYSRTPDSGGRRIERIDHHRPWGWVVVNHGYYKALVDSDTVREQTRERVRRYRARKKEEKAPATVTIGNANETIGNGSKRHTDTDTDTNTTLQGESKASAASSRVPFEEIIKSWNAMATRASIPLVEKTTTELKEKIRGRWKEDLQALPKWFNFFAYIEGNKFLTGRVPAGPGRSKPMRATLLWVINETNFAKIAAREYE